MNQTYPNKELLILFDDDDIATRRFLDSLEEPNNRWKEIPSIPKMSLGNLRNLSTELSTGDFFCQWDDDDWYHEARIEMQLDCILKNHKSACFLAYWLSYDVIDKKAYLSPVGPWPGSILCKKDVLSEMIRYPDMNQDEDYHFMMHIINMKIAVPLVMPSLYIYVSHGQNTFEREHFQYLFAKSQSLPAHNSELIANIFDNKISHADASRLLFDKGILDDLDYFHNAEEQRDLNGVCPASAHKYSGRLPQPVNYNAVLRSQRDFRNCMRTFEMLSLPKHIDPPKNWDSYAALDIIIRHAGDRREEKVILDAGGEMYSAILPQLAACGFKKLTSINLSTTKAERRGDISYEFGDITGTAFPDGTFDFITCLSVIEHGVDLAKYFREMRRILKPGGVGDFDRLLGHACLCPE